MLDNHIYNLIKAIIKRSQAVWKYESYIQDSGDCEECRMLWNRMREADSRLLEELKKALESHAQKGMLK